MAAGRRGVVKSYSLKRYATDKSKTLKKVTVPLLPPLPPQPSSTSAPPHRPSAATGNASRCRQATPAAATRGSSSALCRPTASVRSLLLSSQSRPSGSPAGQSEKGSVCLHRPARRCLTIAPGWSKELPLCCDPLPRVKARWQESPLLPQFGLHPIDFLAFSFFFFEELLSLDNRRFSSDEIGQLYSITHFPPLSFISAMHIRFH